MGNFPHIAVNIDNYFDFTSIYCNIINTIYLSA